MVIICHVYLCVNLDLRSQTYISYSGENIVVGWCMDAQLELDVDFDVLYKLWAWYNDITDAINYYAIFELVF